MSDIWDRIILETPNWNDHVRYFFRSRDVACMANEGIDLETYYGVRLNADRIHFHTERGSMPMPANSSTRWSEAKVTNFYNWMAAGYPELEAHYHIYELNKNALPRVRRSIREYEDDDVALDQLKTAFTGVILKEVDDTSGYFKLAGMHWLPAPAMFCRHHENAYNPWHRAYLIAFEDALRKIDGCEDVTLPYWDIQGDYIPDFLWAEPFSAYQFRSLVEDYRGRTIASIGDFTERQEKAELLRLIREYRDSRSRGRTIDEYIRHALSGERWQEFNGWSRATGPVHDGIIRAHDLGHGLCGTRSIPGTPNRSLAVPNLAAFDPLFWFFHCNWDRLWWRWQLETGATNVDRFKALAEEDNDPTGWIDDPVLSMLQPFNVFTKDVINATEWQIDYTSPEVESPIRPMSLGAGHASAGVSPSIVDANLVSLRVKGINRLAIPGSFYVKILADGEELAETYIFQSDTPQFCRSCTKSGQFSVDFLVDADEIEGKSLDVRITCLSVDGPVEIPAGEYGSPTINARLLLS